MTPTNKFAFLLLATLVPTLSSCGGKTEADDPATAIEGVDLFATGEVQGPSGLIAGSQGLIGGWYTYDDTKSCSNTAFQSGDPIPGTINPPPTAFSYQTYAGNPAAPAAEGEQSGNGAGLHFWGDQHSGFAGGMGVQLKNEGVFDLAAAGYVGVRFIGWASKETMLDVKLSDSLSEAKPGGVDGECKFNDWDLGCVYPGDAAPSYDQGCFNTPLANVTLNTTWREYRVFFNKSVQDDPATPAYEIGPMVRGMWGTTDAGESIDNTKFPLRLNQVYQFQVQTTGADPFDIWLDNVGFILPGGAADTGTPN
jgi:hypothetical protein